MDAVESKVTCPCMLYILLQATSLKVTSIHLSITTVVTYGRFIVLFNSETSCEHTVHHSVKMQFYRERDVRISFIYLKNTRASQRSLIMFLAHWATKEDTLCCIFQQHPGGQLCSVFFEPTKLNKCIHLWTHTWMHFNYWLILYIQNLCKNNPFDASLFCLLENTFDFHPDGSFLTHICKFQLDIFSQHLFSLNFRNRYIDIIVHDKEKKTIDHPECWQYFVKRNIAKKRSTLCPKKLGHVWPKYNVLNMIQKCSYSLQLVSLS